MDKNYFGRFDRYAASELIKALMDYVAWNNQYMARKFITKLLWNLVLATLACILLLIAFFGLLALIMDMFAIWRNAFFVCVFPTVLAVVLHHVYHSSNRKLMLFESVISDESYTKVTSFYESIIPSDYRFYPILEHMYFLLENGKSSDSSELFSLADKYMATNSSKVYQSEITSVNVFDSSEILDKTFLYKISAYIE